MAAFPALAGLEAAAQRRLTENARRVDLPSGAVPFRAGGHCENYILVLSGSVRVQMVSDSGREIVLYRVHGGETCILTTSCLMAEEDYPAEAIAETAVTAVVVPGACFRALLAESATFRSFVFSAYGRRVADLMLLVDEVAFRRIDARLAHCLLDRMDGDGRLALTHQDLAVELGSAREVISRQLKEFERHAWVSLGRGRITVTDAAALRALTAAAD